MAPHRIISAPSGTRCIFDMGWIGRAPAAQACLDWTTMTGHPAPSSKNGESFSIFREVSGTSDLCSGLIGLHGWQKKD